MTRPIRLTVVMTHPVQYSAPWFRHIARSCHDIDLTVLYATQPSPRQQGAGFGTPFCWDVPLLEGYRCRVVRPPRDGDDVDSGAFWGLDVPEIEQAILDTDPAVVLIPGWHSVTQLRAMRACRRAGIPILYRGDSNLLNRPRGWRRFAWSLRTRMLLRQYSGYLSVGQRAREYLLRFGISPTRIFSSPHCVDNDYFAAAAGPHRSGGSRASARAGFGIGQSEYVILFVGKLETKKRPLDLIRAAQGCGRSVRLLIVGTGPLLEACRTEAARLGVQAVWAGFLNQSQLGAAYVAADCLVLPSDAGETWGLVVNEAMATGLPCVVSDQVGCAPDLIVAGETGEVYPMGDVASLSSALNRMQERAQSGRDFGPKCRDRVARYSFEQATVGLLAACSEVTSRQKSTAKARPDLQRPRIVACCGGMVVPFGLERMTFETLRVIRERGAAVHCIVNDWENHRIVPMAERIGATWSEGYYRFALGRPGGNPLVLLRYVAQILRTSYGLWRDCRQFLPSHVLLPEYAAVLRNFPALVYLRLRGVTTILRLGNAPPQGPLYRRLFRWVVHPAVSRIVCNSAFVLHALLAHGIREAKTTVIYNTLATDRRGGADGPLQEPDKIIYVGQVIPEKKVHLLLDAVRQLRQRGFRARLEIVGPMTGWAAPQYEGYRERLLAQASDPDLAGCVQFVGQRDDVSKRMATAAVHVCPSDMAEGCPNVVLEAKQAGVPTVAFALGPYPELIKHAENGWLCPQVSGSSLADGIAAFLSDPDLRRRAGERARESLRDFSRERFAAQWWSTIMGV